MDSNVYWVMATNQGQILSSSPQTTSKEHNTSTTPENVETTSKETNADNLPDIMAVKHICSYLHVSRNKGYEIMKEEDFPSFRLGDKLLRVTRDDFLDWLAVKSGKMLGSQLKQ